MLPLADGSGVGSDEIDVAAGLETEPVVEGGPDIEGDAAGLFGGVKEHFASEASGDEDECAWAGDGFELREEVWQDVWEDDGFVWVIRQLCGHGVGRDLDDCGRGAEGQVLVDE